MTAFQGFGPRALAFLGALAFHQTKAWFEENRALYESDVRGPLAALVADLAAELARRDVPLTGDPKRSIFRINRDVRFSKDKSPYKTNAGATLTRDGSKLSQGLLYVQVAPTDSFVALGFHEPDPAQLAALRGAMVAKPDRWAAVKAALDTAGLPLSREGAAKRMPRGFEAVDPESPLAADLRSRSLIVSRPLTADEILRPDLVGTIADFAVAGRPLLDFGWSALDHARTG
jgi:uncharacterized protein (TIGR02453 family)